MPSIRMPDLWARRRELLGGVVHRTGLGWAYGALARPAGAIVLMYHSVAAEAEARYVDPPNRVPPAEFERQMAFLAARRRVVPLSEVVEQVVSGASPPAGTVCITFDDGYRDNLTIAAPILRRHGLCATLFLATGYVSRGESQWADVLHWMLRDRTRDRLRVEGDGGGEWDLSAPEHGPRARRALHRLLLEAELEARRRLLEDVADQLAPRGSPPRLTLTWAEVRELAERHPEFEMGGHTRDHIDLRRHPGAVARQQIQGCAEDIGRELGRTPRLFSFPYGRWSAESREWVREGGWLGAVGEGRDIRIGAQSDRYAIPRIDAPRTMTDLGFKTSAAHPGVFALLGLR